ncbi:PP0621 family protein [Tepidimonas taiwanensis]|uniref:PP0621 family protein n=1 Tax=Tepidimonas taiwanensis TaxID=307486 RepID=UPI0005B8EEBF|nr:PP0621 family protein [Tepidimonas taiwanensis]
MGKWLLVIAVVALGYFWWCQQRLEKRRAQRPRPAPPPGPAQAAAPAPMVRCRHCGVHLPAADAVRGALGPYCSDEHRRLAEG